MTASASSFRECCGWACIEQSSVGIVEQAGKFTDVAPPGCSYIGCCFGAVRGTVSLRTQMMRVSTRSSTSDGVIVWLDTDIIFHVIPSDCHTAFYALSSQDQLRLYCENATCTKTELQAHSAAAFTRATCCAVSSSLSVLAASSTRCLWPRMGYSAPRAAAGSDSADTGTHQ